MDGPPILVIMVCGDLPATITDTGTVTTMAITLVDAQVFVLVTRIDPIPRTTSTDNVQAYKVQEILCVQWIVKQAQCGKGRQERDPRTMFLPTVTGMSTGNLESNGRLRTKADGPRITRKSIRTKAS